MMHFLFTILLPSVALLSSASILPPRSFLHTSRAYQDSPTLLKSIRQSTCSSKSDCGESQLCTQFIGELFCEEDCDGVCIPEARRGFVCNCDVPCEVGNCVNPVQNLEVDNGICVPDELAGIEPLNCPGSGPPENSSDSMEPSNSGDPEPSDETGTEESEPEPEDPDSSSNGDGSESDNVEPGTDDSDSSEPEDSGDEQDGSVSGSDDNESKPESNETEAEGGVESNTEPSSDGNGSETENASGSESDSKPEADDDPSPTNSGDTSDSVCIGADMLDEFESHELVFPKHVLSHVLCDAFGSCATKGHIVTYEGSGMMMSSYCAVVGCTEKVMYVNSPKYRGGLRVGSRSRGMEFTSLAARFATHGEEVVLRAAVRMGL